MHHYKCLTFICCDEMFLFFIYSECNMNMFLKNEYFINYVKSFFIFTYILYLTLHYLSLNEHNHQYFLENLTDHEVFMKCL